MATVTMNDDKPPQPAPPPRGMSLARAWPVFAFAGVAYLIAAAVKVVVHQPEGGLYAICGVAFLAFGWIVRSKATGPGKSG
jgi:hypothetical protein